MRVEALAAGINWWPTAHRSGHDRGAMASRSEARELGGPASVIRPEYWEQSIEVLDVARGRIVLTVPQAAGFVDECVIQFRRVSDLLVTARGSIVWISEKGSHCKTTTLQVYSEQVSGTPSCSTKVPRSRPNRCGLTMVR